MGEKGNWLRARPRPSVFSSVFPELPCTKAGALWERDLGGALKILEFVL